MSSLARTIVIVGAGFTGTTLAVNLLRRVHRRPLRIVLLDRSQIGRGVAYAKRPYPYLLNVPAGRMSANASDPAEFLTFARRQRHDASAEDFLPRALYGDYLESSLRSAASEAPPHVEVKRAHAVAVEIERFHRTSVVEVHLADGRRLEADTVVLALGNPPPAPLPGAQALRGSARYVEDPWHAPACIARGETVLVVGTGLTAADTIVAGHHATNGRAVFHAVSRHGLLPPPQTTFQRSPPYAFDAQVLLRAASASLPRLVRAVRALAKDLALSGGDWRELIAFTRELAPTLWQRLPNSERRRFLRHVHCYWDIHRHRLPESIWATLHALRGSGQLHIHAGRLVGLERAGRQIRVVLRRRGSGSVEARLVDRVINCTGPDYNVRRSRDRLLRSLVAQRVATPEPHGLGQLSDG